MRAAGAARPGQLGVDGGDRFPRPCQVAQRGGVVVRVDLLGPRRNDIPAGRQTSVRDLGKQGRSLAEHRRLDPPNVRFCRWILTDCPDGSAGRG